MNLENFNGLHFWSEDTNPADRDMGVGEIE